MSSAAAILIGSAFAIGGLLLMWFRVPVAAFFREARERQGSRNAASQTPALTFAVGAFFLVFGAFLAIGTLAGWVYPT